MYTVIILIVFLKILCKSYIHHQYNDSYYFRCKNIKVHKIFKNWENAFFKVDRTFWFRARDLWYFTFDKKPQTTQFLQYSVHIHRCIVLFPPYVPNCILSRAPCYYCLNSSTDYNTVTILNYGNLGSLMRIIRVVNSVFKIRTYMRGAIVN